MKQLRYLMFFVASLVLSSTFYSCEDDDKNSGNSNDPVIHRVFLEDANSTDPDREVSFVRLGQVIRIEGENLVGMTKVFVNGYNNSFNPVFITNTSMIIQISDDVPVAGEAEESVRDKIRFEKGSKFTIFDFDIRSGAPSITKISHTLPNPGEWITVTGSGLVEVTKVVFPGNIEVTDNIQQGIDGKFFMVKVPMQEMPEKGGSIFIECSNGGAYSPAYFGCKSCVILDFDGRGEHGFWGEGGMIKDTDILEDLIGEGNTSQKKYCPMIPARLTPISAGTSRATEVWTSGNEDWNELFITSGLIAGNTPVSEVAVQFDIYVPKEWNETGSLGINFINSFSSPWSGDCYNYIPWLNGATKVPFSTKPDKDTPAGWITVTVPFSDFYFVAQNKDGAFSSFNDIVAKRGTATNKNFGLMIHNSDFTLKDITGKDTDEATAFPSNSTGSLEIYIDNLRIVSLATPKYSDFPDEE